MTTGFIDMASINSALAVLREGKSNFLSSWHKQSLLELTYLLLHKDIKVVPGLTRSRGARGFYGNIVEAFPGIEFQTSYKNQATRSTQVWSKRNLPLLKKAWNQADTDLEFTAWRQSHGAINLIEHSEVYGALFDQDFIPQISEVLGRSEKEVKEAHELSRSPKTVKEWLKKDLGPTEAKIAESSWVIGGLIRGRYHDYLARAERMHMLSHPFRKGIERKLKAKVNFDVNKSEELFVKMIIGSSLCETSAIRRVGAWVHYVSTARKFIENNSIVLPEAAIHKHAEKHAVRAAKDIDLPGSPAAYRRALDIAASLGLPSLLKILISPWAGTLGPVAQQAYRHHRGNSIGDDLGRVLFARKHSFLKLAKSVPGRIERVY